MRYDLLSNLELSSDRDWLWCDKVEKSNINSQISTLQNCSQDLFKLTKQRIEQILSFKKNSDRRFKIVIVEAKPTKFLAAFMAALITETDVFLCDPNWQDWEWQQVVDIVQPDLVFGKQTIKDLTPQVILQNHGFAKRGSIMIPTGGTSGKIKFAIHSWSTLSASVMGFQNYFDCQEINSFCTLPLYHVSGLMQFMRSWLTSGKLIICPYKMLEKKRQIINPQNFFISLVPTQLQFLIDIIPNWLNKFKAVLLGGAPATRSLLNKARKYQIPLAPTYGMTETASGVVTLKPEDFLNNNSSSGRVLPHAEITIKSETNSKEDNNIGLIQINADSLFWGYYPQFFYKDRVLVTDDLGYFDREGYLYLVGRNSHKIITGGENVYPAEVEEVILATKLVEDVCIIGTSDRHWGQAVTAVYVPLSTQPDLELIKTIIKSQLAKYKQPKYWISVDRLPRNNRGKLNYQKVREILNRRTTNN